MRTVQRLRFIPDNWPDWIFVTAAPRLWHAILCRLFGHVVEVDAIFGPGCIWCMKVDVE